MNDHLKRQWLCALLALLLGFQSLAAGALPCAHVAAHGDGMGAPAHCHQAEDRRIADSPPQLSHFACMKCAINAVASLYDLPIGGVSIASSLSSQPVFPTYARHFYRFVPQRPDRPPIASVA